MPPHLNQTLEIRPTAPDDLVRGLLALPFAQVRPLRTGDSAGGCAREGEFALVAAVKGQLTVTSHQQYALLVPGQALALHAAGSYTVQAVSDCLCMTVLLRGELAGRLLSPLLAEGAALFPSGAGAVREAVLALSVLEEESPPVGGGMASSYAYSLLMKLRGGPVREAGEVSSVSHLVEGAIAIIQEDFPYLEGLDDLASRLEISKAHLIRTFTRETGISPAKYITRVRVEYAKLLLQDEDTSIIYVAEASGFANANYFAKVFRRETGMSPSEYLESLPQRTGHRERRQDRHPVW